ncbi:transcription elongation nusA domain protein [Mycobacterium xenopi 4042]|uniref:Transcription elongation nusA domain protein n=1 Tax=Mycobacterium xenopi 4042 TaxID=1299334 RepID=X8AN42_MYCXE|nr:transcription elongation nusA domain protein [Mycobacterium xenopi 4042]
MAVRRSGADEHRHGRAARDRSGQRHFGGCRGRNHQIRAADAYRHTEGHQPDARIDIDRKPVRYG